MNFAEMLAHMSEENERSQPRAPALAPELLVEHQQRYAKFLAGCQFKPGQLVTPRKDAAKRGAGEPHIVLEVAEKPPAPHFTDETGSNANGLRLDLRVARFMGDHIGQYWVESVDFEPWTAN